MDEQTSILSPSTSRDMSDVLRDFAQARTPVHLQGYNSLNQFGRSTRTSNRVSTARMAGIIAYEPAEMVMQAKAGTPLHEIEETLAQNKQCLGFEPADLAGLVNAPKGPHSIGGVFATNNASSSRLGYGSARDHLLGIEGVNGRGEIFANGGAVMKNVTGLDVTKAMAGSWGTLAALTKVTFKVRPIADSCRTLLIPSLDDAMAIDCLRQLINTPYEIVSAVHLTGDYAHRALAYLSGGDEDKLTAIRIEGDQYVLARRIEKLTTIAGHFAQVVELDDIDSRRFWQGLRTMGHLAGGAHEPLWRIITKPNNAAQIVAKLARMMPVTAAYDWGGGLIWLGVEESGDLAAADIRRTVGLYGGYADLIRASEHMREQVSVFHPLDPPLMALQKGLKQAFDPENILNPERMYKGV